MCVVGTRRFVATGGLVTKSRSLNVSVVARKGLVSVAADTDGLSLGDAAELLPGAPEAAEPFKITRLFLGVRNGTVERAGTAFVIGSSVFGTGIAVDVDVQQPFNPLLRRSETYCWLGSVLSVGALMADTTWADSAQTNGPKANTAQGQHCLGQHRIGRHRLGQHCVG